MVNNSINRRRALKIVGTSAGLGSISVVTAGSASDDKVEITTIKSNDSESEDVTKEVPQDWYQFIKTARKASRDLGTKLQSKDWFERLTRASSDRTVSGKNVPLLEIESTNVSQAKNDNEVPEEKDGVDVNVVEAQDPQPHSICDDTEWDCIPGGAIIRTERDDGTGITRCSLTCEIQYQANDHLMTSAHCFNACDEDPIGYHLKHGGEVIGEVVEYDVNLDFAVIEPVDGLRMDDSIIDESQSIFGHVTRDGVEDLRDSGETVYHYGSTSCKTSGVVDGITPNLQGSCDFDIEAPKMTTNADPGDSGGPHYHREQSLLFDALAIIGPHWGGDSYEWAPPGYTITDQYDITFGGSTCDGL